MEKSNLSLRDMLLVRCGESAVVYLDSIFVNPVDRVPLYRFVLWCFDNNRYDIVKLLLPIDYENGK